MEFWKNNTFLFDSVPQKIKYQLDWKGTKLDEKSCVEDKLESRKRFQPTIHLVHLTPSTPFKYLRSFIDSYKPLPAI